MRHLLITTALALTPYAATAETQAERFETLTEDMTQVMWGMMATEAENAGGDGTAIRAAIGKFAWTDALDAATTCVLDRYTTQIGSDGIDDLFDRMDRMIGEMDGMSITQFSEDIDPTELMPAGMTEAQSIEINEACGMADAQLEMMEQTGFTAALIATMSQTAQ